MIEITPIDPETKVMLEVLFKMDKAHRLVSRYDNGAYVVTLEVGEACMKDGWMPIKDLPTLIRWLGARA